MVVDFLAFPQLAGSIACLRRKLFVEGICHKDCQDIHVDRKRTIAWWLLVPDFLVLGIGGFAAVSLVLETDWKINIYLYFEGVILALLIAVGEKWLPIHLPQQFGPQTMMATAFYLTGYLSHRWVGVMNHHGSSWMVLLLAIPAIAAIFLDLGMMTTTDFEIILYFIVAMCGTFGVLSLSKWMSRHRISTFFKYVGDKTLYILIFHFIAFKLVSFVYIACNRLSVELLSQFPVMDGVPSWLWVVYSIAGVAVSLLMWEVINRISIKIKTIKTNKQNGI